MVKLSSNEGIRVKTQLKKLYVRSIDHFHWDSARLTETHRDSPRLTDTHGNAQTASSLFYFSSKGACERPALKTILLKVCLDIELHKVELLILKRRETPYKKNTYPYFVLQKVKLLLLKGGSFARTLSCWQEKKVRQDSPRLNSRSRCRASFY